MRGDVFISHSKEDRTVANAAVAMLEGRGIRCWIAPRDITPGLDWSAEIIEAIEQARVMVLVYSVDSNASPQIKREVERAVSQGLPIVTFRLADVPMNKSLEYFISTPHWLDAMSPPLERHLDYLADTVKLLLSRPGPERVPAMAEPAAPPPEFRPPAPAPMPPSSAPEPRPAPNRMRVAAIAAAAVVAIAGYVFFRPTAVNSAGVERQFAGTWGMHALEGGKSNDILMTVDANGHYRSHVTVTETGNITASNGQYQMANTGGEVVQGTYGPVTPASVTMTGPLGTADWRRKAGTPVPSTTGSLTGTWELTFPAAGATWNATLEIAPQGSYRVVSVTDDAGTFQAANGSWHTVSQVQNGATQSGTYQFLGDGSVSMTGPLGTALWSRR